jgi:hypothetical protein
MKKRNTPPDKGKPDYKVGYGKPPKRTRFRPGQSGNPKGRPKGVRNFSTDVQRALRRRVRINLGGRTRIVTHQEFLLMALHEQVQKARDPRAIKLDLELASRFNNDDALESHDQVEADDHEILRAFLENHTKQEAAPQSRIPRVRLNSDPRKDHEK